MWCYSWLRFLLPVETLPQPNGKFELSNSDEFDIARRDSNDSSVTPGFDHSFQGETSMQAIDTTVCYTHPLADVGSNIAPANVQGSSVPNSPDVNSPDLRPRSQTLDSSKSAMSGSNNSAQQTAPQRPSLVVHSSSIEHCADSADSNTQLPSDSPGNQSRPSSLNDTMRFNATSATVSPERMPASRPSTGSEREAYLPPAQDAARPQRSLSSTSGHSATTATSGYASPGRTSSGGKSRVISIAFQSGTPRELGTVHLVSRLQSSFLYITFLAIRVKLTCSQ